MSTKLMTRLRSPLGLSPPLFSRITRKSPDLSSLRLIHTTLPFPKSHEPVSDPPKTPNFINNALQPSTTSNWIPLHDPATNTVVTHVPDSTPSELSATIDAASAAFPSWSSTSVISRQAILFRYTALIRSHMSHLAALITHEQGKTLADARGDVLRGLQVAETACGITTQIPGQVLEVAAGMETRSYRAPLGVVAAICPFNFPAMIPLWSIPVALATGNTIIIKPSERDPGAAVLLAELAREAGVPDGVVGVVNGGRGVVEGLIEDDRVKAISFVGSDRAGQEIYQKATAKGKRVQANLGAKNHGVLMPDCEKAEALKAVVGAAFGAAGQRCMALSTLVLVGDTVEWEGDLVEQARKLKVNGGFEEDADLGPVISPASRERIEGLIQGASEQGARILLDGRGFKPEKYPDGNWVSLSAPPLPPQTDLPRSLPQ